MPVGELLQRMTSRELAEWMALYQIEYEEERERMLAAKAQQGLHAQISRRGRRA